MGDLTHADLVVLERLNTTGAATITDLAVRLRDLPDRIEPTLKKFQGEGLVEMTPIGGKYDGEVYRISNKGRRFLQFVHSS